MQLSTVTLLSSVHSEVSGLLLLSYIGNGQEELFDGQTGIGQEAGNVVFNLGRVTGPILNIVLITASFIIYLGSEDAK